MTTPDRIYNQLSCLLDGAELDRWLHTEQPDIGATPEVTLAGGNPSELHLLARLVNAISTSCAASHPTSVRDIVRHRIETLFEDAIDLAPIACTVSLGTQRGTPHEQFERWLDTANPAFGDTPRRFFEADEVDVHRLHYISGILDAADGGAFS